MVIILVIVMKTDSIKQELESSFDATSVSPLEGIHASFLPVSVQVLLKKTHYGDFKKYRRYLII